jgi:hypothetical protein
MKNFLKKMIFPLTGLIALIWVLIRVIPKPSRAAYPCMRASAPIATSFILYLVSFFSSIVLFKKARVFASQQKYLLFSITLLAGLSLGIYSFVGSNSSAYARYQVSVEAPNSPIGVGKGIFPGRVTWIHNPAATDETCRNTTNDYWFHDSNTNQLEVNQMLSEGLQLLSGATSDSLAWEAIFRSYNQNHSKGDVGYSSGEKIVIKLNLNNGPSGTQNARATYQMNKIDTSPQLLYALLDQLINVAGVAQQDIRVGDPGKNLENIFWDKCHTAFPDVKYWGEGSGRTPIVQSANVEFFNSDGGESNYLPVSYLEAAYMINVPVFKKHHRAGVSVAAKNHFGTFVPFRGGAFHMHYSLPAPEGGGDVSNGSHGVYRCFVDIMGHRDLGDKTILYLVDGLWGSTNWGHPPIKWQMAPFNNDWPSSLFLSQDPVAIESVCFDFLYEEFDANHPTEGTNDAGDNTGPFPHYSGVDDYLHQAADEQYRPAGFIYDPENDGTGLPASLGVHEHWDNAISKNYSRNLGAENGIELIGNMVTNIDPGKDMASFSSYQLNQNYPNPFNGNTNIWYNLAKPSQVNLSIYNSLGQKIKTLVSDYQSPGAYLVNWNGLNDYGNEITSGIYLYELKISGSEHNYNQVRKMVYAK